MTAFIPIAILVVWFVIAVALEPRRLGHGVLLLVIVLWVLFPAVLSGGALVVESAGQGVLPYLLIGALGLVVLLIALLGVFLVFNAFTMWRKEGLGLAPRISGVVGAAMLVYVVAAVFMILVGAPALVGPMLFLGLPAAYIAFVFAAFLLYSLLYVWFSNRFGQPVDAVVVLGSGLGGGERVTPLLAGRLRRGLEVFTRSRAKGKDCVLIVSGGKGEDEHLSEAAAMADWVRREGEVPDERLLLEDKSRDTAENLEFSADLIRQEHRAGRVAVATSNYHAFRAAIIMRKAGVRGYTVGCRTARYYWPSATVREFIAILVEHSRFNVVIIGLLCLPLVFYIVNLLASLF